MSHTSNQATLQTPCPECAGVVPFVRAPLQGEVVRCPECNCELEVTDTDPITIEIAPQVREDWGE